MLLLKTELQTDEGYCFDSSIPFLLPLQGSYEVQILRRRN